MTKETQTRFVKAATQTTLGLEQYFMVARSTGILNSPSSVEAVKEIARRAITENLEPQDVLDMAVEYMVASVRSGIENKAGA